MGAKTWMLVAAEGDAWDRIRMDVAPEPSATLREARRLFPKDKLTSIEQGSLAWMEPPDGVLVIGCFEGLTVLAAKEFGIDHPSRLDVRFIKAFPGRNLYLHAMHSVVDWFAYALWRNGELTRSLSVSPEHGVMENLGQPLEFETPYWAGAHAQDEGYPLPFHPLELGEEALGALFGYQLEGWRALDLDPERVPLLRYRRRPLRFGLW